MKIRRTRGGRVSITINGTFSIIEAQLLARLIERCATQSQAAKDGATPATGASDGGIKDDDRGPSEG